MEPIDGGPKNSLGRKFKDKITREKDDKFAHFLAHMSGGIGYLDDEFSYDYLMYRTLKAIVEEYVPGFAVKYRTHSGRPRIWDRYRRAKLLENFKAFCLENKRLRGTVRYSAFAKEAGEFQGVHLKVLRNHISNARKERKLNIDDRFVRYVKMLRMATKIRNRKNLPENHWTSFFREIYSAI